MNTFPKNSLSGSCLLVLLFLAGLVGCSKLEDYNQPSNTDQTKPGPVSNVKVDNFNGGAYITYSLPENDNLLYVSAQYRINDRLMRETKSSYYSDSITVSGFAEARDYDVTLYAVSRSEVKSDPVVIQVHPLTPAYRLVKPTLEMTADFGGIRITGANDFRQPIGLVILARDTITNTLEIQDQYYTDRPVIDYSLRGLQAKEREFGVYVTDRFNNISDTLLQNVTPLYEELLDKSKFSPYRLPTDGTIAYGWELPNLWNGNTGGEGWHTAPGGPIPMIATFSIGQTAKLSRIVVWERTDEYTYSHGNPRLFSLWGSNKDAPQDAALPRVAEEGMVIGDWTNLGNFVFPDPPSGLPPSAINDADRAFVAAGVSFNVPLASPAVKYLRLSVSETWSKGDFAHIMEISLYGTNE